MKQEIILNKIEKFKEFLGNLDHNELLVLSDLLDFEISLSLQEIEFQNWLEVKNEQGI